jgi:hypothetical protein
MVSTRMTFPMCKLWTITLAVRPLSSKGTAWVLGMLSSRDGDTMIYNPVTEELAIFLRMSVSFVPILVHIARARFCSSEGCGP